MPELERVLLGYVFDDEGRYRQPVEIRTFDELAGFLFSAGREVSHVRITTCADEFVWDSEES